MATANSGAIKKFFFAFSASATAKHTLLLSHPPQTFTKQSLFSTVASSSSSTHELSFSEEVQKKKELYLKKKMKKAKKKQRETPIIEPLTVLEPAHHDLKFAFRYSYTEIPKVKPIGFQEKFSPFGPGRLDRPWDGQEAPPVASDKSASDTRDMNNSSISSSSKKKKTKISNKVRTREEILGEPLTKEETTQLLERSFKATKQLNIGRDGLTHNMLINFYNYWQRDSVIRVKCKGVATVDMDNVIFQIEDKTGGKVIHRAGGTLHVFRGRYYNKKDRPDIPLMLWKPHSPIYPKLITQKPGGLKLQEANALRKRGRQIMPLCRLSKNGYYADLVHHVREAFEDDDLVRIDCKALNISDYKKIGAKLRDMVPCILLSFQGEQIILWKGRSRKVETNSTEEDRMKVHTEDELGNNAICENTGKSSDIDDDAFEVDQTEGSRSSGKHVSDTDDARGPKGSENVDKDISDADDDSISDASESLTEDISDTDDDSISKGSESSGEVLSYTDDDSGSEGSESSGEGLSYTHDDSLSEDSESVGEDISDTDDDSISKGSESSGEGLSYTDDDSGSEGSESVG